MDPTGEARESAGLHPLARCPPIVWETQNTTSSTPIHALDFQRLEFQRVDQPMIDSAARIDHGAFETSARATSSIIRRRVRRWAAILSNPTFSQLHGRSPMETTRIATTSVSEAADVLDRSGDVEWGRGRTAGQLHLGPFRTAPTELGRPHIADATLHGPGLRRIRVTVAIFRYGDNRCGIQIRPEYRRPWSSRRLRHCLQSTHAAADRLRELVLAVDFMPPPDTATAIPAA